MACEIAIHDRVVLVLWGKPEISDLPRVEFEVRKACSAAGPVLFIARVPELAEPPEPHVRAAITAMLERFMALCASYHTVIEGGGFGAAAKRMVLSTIFLMTGRRKQNHVHSACDAVAAVVPQPERALIEVAMRAFRSRGLLDRSSPHSSGVAERAMHL